jgi:hypothetical protein
MPTQGKQFATFQSEDATCRNWAERSLGMPVQETYDNNLATGAVVGTAAGAGLGAAIGSASGNAGTGAAIGAVSGLFVGSIAGSSSGQAYGQEAQRRYDNVYVQCMYSYGNQVPGNRTHVVAKTRKPVVVASSTPPPPPPPPPNYDNIPPDLTPEAPLNASPPEVYMDAGPEFIYAPELSMYVAVGVPYDLVYYGNEYYYFYGGRWYYGPYYNGPWIVATGRHYPQAFYRYKIHNIRHYRDLEYRRYDLDRGHYNGQFHRPEYRGGGVRRGEIHNEGHGDRHR